MNGYKEIPITYMRGGTSKGAYLLKDTLPTDPAARDRMILDLYGSPDARQINGIGGADPLTSKVAIVNPSDRDDADIDYTFGYVVLLMRGLIMKGTVAIFLLVQGYLLLWKAL